jgi:16S rRNA processing protein RimM
VRGLKGQVRVEILTDQPEVRFAAGGELFPEGASRALTIAESSAVADGPGWWLRFREIRDRTAAETLKGVYLEVPSDALTQPGTWRWHEIIGLSARTTDGRDLGVVRDVYRTGGAEVYVVHGSRGEVDVPAVRGIVVELDPPRGVLLVDAEALALDDVPERDDPDERQPRPPAPRRPRRRERRARRAAAGPGSASSPPSPPSPEGP